MKNVWTSILIIPFFIAVTIFSRFLTFLAEILASRWTRKNHDPNALCLSRSPGTKEDFFSCTSLEDIQLPESLVRIENSAFGYCSQLADVTIPAGVHEFGDWKLFEENTIWIVYPGSDAEAYCKMKDLEFRNPGDPGSDRG